MPSFRVPRVLIYCLIAAAQCCRATSGVLRLPGDSEQRLTSAAQQDKVAFLPGWGEPDRLFAGQACICCAMHICCHMHWVFHHCAVRSARQWHYAAAGKEA